MAHSPEPWRVQKILDWRYRWIIASNDAAVCREAEDSSLGNANVDRIVACVNALQGIPTEVLQKADKPTILNDSRKGLFIHIRCPPLQSRPGFVMRLEP